MNEPSTSMRRGISSVLTYIYFTPQHLHVKSKVVDATFRWSQTFVVTRKYTRARPDLMQVARQGSLIRR